jgi:hypothetical protein
LSRRLEAQIDDAIRVALETADVVLRPRTLH